MSDLMENLLSQHRAIEPYVPGEQPRIQGLIKLNTNENPYPPSPLVQEALKALTEDTARLRLYPDPEARELKRLLAEEAGVAPDQVFLGAGSDDVLANCFMALMNSGRPVAFPDVTYSFYKSWAALFGRKTAIVPLREDFTWAPEDYDGEYAAILLANPNAPTGIEAPMESIRRILADHPEAVVIVDEAYADFGEASAISLLSEFSNLLVVRTFSKSRSLAGLRVGYAYGSPRLIGELEACRSSFNSYPLNLPAQAAALAAVKDRAYFEDRIRDVIAERSRFTAALRELGFTVLPSSANFVFARDKSRSGQEMMELLRANRILVRHFPGERTGDFLRITIGKPEDMNRFLEVVR